VGWDLAHAIGNVPLSLQECDADFAAWCSYKYLNAGPGAVAGAFIHERHVRSAEIPRLAGWWGTDPATRFRMDATFAPAPTADAWSLSNPPILSLAPLKASLELFDRASMARLRDKSMKLTGYLEDLLRDLHAHREGAGRSGIEILTPSDPARRGCQLSIVVPGASRTIQTKLLERGVLCDFREPNVIRAAPVPLYNSFHDVWRFTEAFAALLP
jgi:kynureninase